MKHTTWNEIEHGERQAHLIVAMEKGFSETVAEELDAADNAARKRWLENGPSVSLN